RFSRDWSSDVCSSDLALMMVAGDITAEEVVDPRKEIAFPESVIQMMRGDLGQPPGGWPEALQRKILKGQQPITVRPGSLIPPARSEERRVGTELRSGR